MKLGFAGALSVGAAIATVVLSFAVYSGAFMGIGLLIAIAVGLISLGLAIWRGATRWLVLLLPIFLVPGALLLILFNCDKCIA